MGTFLCPRKVRNERMEYLFLPSSGWVEVSQALRQLKSQDSWVLSPGEQPSFHRAVNMAFMVGLRKVKNLKGPKRPRSLPTQVPFTLLLLCPSFSRSWGRGRPKHWR